MSRDYNLSISFSYKERAISDTFGVRTAIILVIASALSVSLTTVARSILTSECAESCVTNPGRPAPLFLFLFLFICCMLSEASCALTLSEDTAGTKYADNGEVRESKITSFTWNVMLSIKNH